MLEFRSVQKQHPVPCYIVADFESFLTPIDRAETDDSSGLTITDEHVVSGFCIYRVTQHVRHQRSGSHDRILRPRYAEAREISRIVQGYVDMLPLTEQQTYDCVKCACDRGFDPSTLRSLNASVL